MALTSLCFYFLLIFAFDASHHQSLHQPVSPSLPQLMHESPVARDGMRTELESLIKESESLSLQTKEYQQQLNALNHEYQETRKQLISCLSQDNQETDRKPDPWNPLTLRTLPDVEHSPPKAPGGRARIFRLIKSTKSGTSPQLSDQSIDPVVSLLTKMIESRDEINTMNHEIMQNVEAKDELDQNIENLLLRWSLNQHSDPDHAKSDLLQKDLNLPPIPPSKRPQPLLRFLWSFDWRDRSR